LKKQGPGRPMNWGPDSDMGKVLRALVMACNSWDEVRQLVNNTFGTDYTETGIRSAAYRQGLTLAGKPSMYNTAIKLQEKYHMSSWDDIPTYDIEDDREWVPICPFGDMHIGNEYFMDDLFEAYIDYWADIQAYTYCVGDVLETAVPYHLPQAMWEQSCTPREQIRYAKDRMEKIKGRLIGMTPGNHEKRVINATSIDPIESIAEAYECLYMRRGGIVNLKTKNTEYVFLFKHGVSFAKDYKREVQEYASLYPIADVVCLGHVHVNESFDVNEHFVMEVNNGRATRKPISKTGVRTGHCLGYGGYLEDRPFKPHKPGFPVIWINTKEKLVYTDNNGAMSASTP